MTHRPTEEPSDRLKKDIEEILNRMEGGVEEREPLRVAAQRKPRVVKPRSGRGMQPGILMAIGAVLLVLAIVVPPLRLALAVGGFALLGAGYWKSWQSNRKRSPARAARTRQGDEVQYWRGQRIEYDDKQRERGNVVEFRETRSSRLRRWLNRRRR